MDAMHGFFDIEEEVKNTQASTTILTASNKASDAANPSTKPVPPNSTLSAPPEDEPKIDISGTAQNESEQPPSAAQAHPPDAMDVDIPPTDHRPITIFSAPTSGTPAAALRTDSDEAFAPRIEHAQAHQRLLKTAGENKRQIGRAHV